MAIGGCVCQQRVPLLSLPQANTEKRAYAEGNLETGRIERVFEDWDEMSSQIVNLDGVLHYFRAGVGLCEYDKATNQESVKFPMDVYCAEVSYTKDYIFMRTSDSKEFTQRTLWALDRDYQLLGKVEQERIGLYFPFLEYTTANAIYFSPTADHHPLHRPPPPGPSGADPTGGPHGKEPRIIRAVRMQAFLADRSRRYRERCHGPLPAPTNTP